MSPDWSCTVYLYTKEHAVENIAYHRFQLISVTRLSLAMPRRQLGSNLILCIVSLVELCIIFVHRMAVVWITVAPSVVLDSHHSEQK